jgi:hypothetical protein
MMKSFVFGLSGAARLIGLIVIGCALGSDSAEGARHLFSG